MSNLIRLFEQHVKGTAKQAIVTEVTIVLCTLTNAVVGVCVVDTTKVYVSSKMLKHLFDKRPAEEFDFLLNHMWKVVRFPDEIYENKDSKRGSFAFVKRMKDDLYICSLEIVIDGETGGNTLNVATAFRINKPSYIKDYKLLWSWRGDTPSS